VKCPKCHTEVCSTSKEASQSQDDMEVEVVLLELSRPPSSSFGFTTCKYSIWEQALVDPTAAPLSTFAEGGLPVTYVAPRGVAASAGMEVNDVIVRVGGMFVTELKATDVVEAIRTCAQPVQIEVLRQRPKTDDGASKETAAAAAGDNVFTKFASGLKEKVKTMTKTTPASGKGEAGSATAAIQQAQGGKRVVLTDKQGRGGHRKKVSQAEEESLSQQFADLTGADYGQSYAALDAANWDLQQAVDAFFSGAQGSPTEAPSSGGQQLSAQHQTLIAQVESVAQCSSADARRLLEQCNWDVERAIDAFLTQATTQPAAQQQRPGGGAVPFAMAVNAPAPRPATQPPQQPQMGVIPQRPPQSLYGTSSLQPPSQPPAHNYVYQTSAHAQRPPQPSLYPQQQPPAAYQTQQSLGAYQQQQPQAGYTTQQPQQPQQPPPQPAPRSSWKAEESSLPAWMSQPSAASGPVTPVASVPTNLPPLVYPMGQGAPQPTGAPHAAQAPPTYPTPAAPAPAQSTPNVYQTPNPAALVSQTLPPATAAPAVAPASPPPAVSAAEAPAVVATPPPAAAAAQPAPSAYATQATVAAAAWTGPPLPSRWPDHRRSVVVAGRTGPRQVGGCLRGARAHRPGLHRRTHRR